jgi:putative intracellular protease/amidase
MFDLATDQTSIQLIHSFAAARKPISAVCHGPCVFLNVTTPSGAPLIADAEVTGFSNEEEDQVQLSSVMPFMLEDELRTRSGGRYVKAEQAWGEKVVVSQVKEYGGWIITGQNPASAGGVGVAIARALGV